MSLTSEKLDEMAAANLAEMKVENGPLIPQALEAGQLDARYLEGLLRQAFFKGFSRGVQWTDELVAEHRRHTRV